MKGMPGVDGLVRDPHAPELIGGGGGGARAVGGVPAAGDRGRAPTRAWLVPLAVVVIGMFMVVLDMTIVNIAMATIQNEFGASADQVQWVATAYNLALGVVVPATGWLGDRYGLGRVYTFGLLAFAIGSALCGLAWSLETLIVFRIVQAVGGGVLPPIAMAMAYRIVPKEQTGMGMGLYGLGIIFAPAIGPTLGGYLVQDVSWRLIFYVNVPIAVLGALVALAVLPRFPRRVGERFDVAGFATVATGLFSLLLAFSEGQTWGWSSYRILLLVALGLFSLALFVVVELSVAQPLIDLGVLRHATYVNSVLIVTLLSIGLFAGMFYVPLFLQEGQGLGALQTGIMLLPEALMAGLMMPFSGRLYDRIGARWPGMVGLLCVAVGSYLMHGINLQTPRLHVVLWMVVRSAGLGLAMAPVMAGGMSVIPDALTARATAVVNTVRNVSGALGLAVLTAVLDSHQAQQSADQVALIPGVPGGLSQFQPIVAQGRAGVLGLDRFVQLQSFGGGIEDVLLLTAGISAIGALLALFMPGRAPAVVLSPSRQDALRD